MVVEPNGVTQRKLHVFCPMERHNVGLEGCVDCPHCAGFDTEGSEERRPLVLCMYPAPPVAPRSRPVGSLLARHSICVRLDALEESLEAVPASTSAIPVVDEGTYLVAVLVPGTRRVIDAPLRLVQKELAPVADALVRMAGCRVRQAPVVSHDGRFVGAVDDLDLMRVLSDRGT
jgi:CBS domain-containing protein